MDSYMMDFLTFKKFISTDALIVFYYIGSIILPIIIWILLIWLIQKYKLFSTAYKVEKKIVWNALNKKQKTQFVLFFITSFLFMELFWRMFFEFLIAYMQIRDALLQIHL